MFRKLKKKTKNKFQLEKKIVINSFLVAQVLFFAFYTLISPNLQIILKIFYIAS